MRVRIDDQVSTLLIFWLFIVPYFLGSFKIDFYTWELRILAWIVMAVAIYGLFQFYLVQDGCYYGKGILG